MDTVSATTSIYIKKSILLDSPFWTPIFHTPNNGTIFVVNINNINLVYLPKYNCLKITTSITKLLYQSNSHIFNYSDLEMFYDKINSFIKFVLPDVNVNNIKNWNISRLDLAANFYCYNNNDKKYYIEFLKNLNYSRCLKKDYTTSVHCHNQSITYNFYDKNEEELSRGLQPSNSNILRLEIQLKNSALYKEFKDNKTVDHVLSSRDKLNSIYKKQLDKLNILNKPLSLNDTLSKINTLISENKITSATGNNIINFMLKDPCNIKSTTFYRYKNILKKHNLNILTLKSEVNNYIDFSNFKLFENKDNVYIVLYYFFCLLFWLIILLFKFINAYLLFNIYLYNYFIFNFINYLDDS